MADKKVKLKDQLGRVVRLDDGASGATLGRNLYGPDGKLLTADQIINPPAAKPTLTATVWKLIREIPANIQKLAALIGRGFAIRRDDGEWALRTLQPGDGIDIANGDGEDGNPTISLEDLPNSGVGAALVKITRDGKGRVEGTQPASTTDLAEGSNLYFTDARADARISAQKGQPNGLAPLDANSLIPTSYLPPLALTDVFVVNSQAAQLALVAQEGDVAIRSDISKNYIHNGGTAGTMADWTELLTPAPPVQSVNGKTGTVVLVPGDVGAATAAQGTKADSALQPGAAHNTSLSGLQGGAVGEYYHATAAQNAALAALAISGYIDGFRMVWNSGTSVTFESGTAAIQSSGTLLRSPTAITKASLSLAVSTFVHAYAYSNAGTPDIELSTTAPAAAYIGTARSKTGDPSRRYIGSMLTTPTGDVRRFVQSDTEVSYLDTLGAAPYRILAAGSATSPTAVSVLPAAPITATQFKGQLINNVATGFFVISAPGGMLEIISVAPNTRVVQYLPIFNSQMFYYNTLAGGSSFIDLHAYVFER